MTDSNFSPRYYKPGVIFVGVGDHSRNGEDPGEILVAIMSITPHSEFRLGRMTLLRLLKRETSIISSISL